MFFTNIKRKVTFTKKFFHNFCFLFFLSLLQLFPFCHSVELLLSFRFINGHFICNCL